MSSPRLQILTNIKVKANSCLFYNVKLKIQAIQMIQTMSTTKEYKTTFTKQAKEILDISDPKSIARTIKENIELQIEICFKR